MTAVEVFQFPATGSPVRTVVIDGQPWFVAKDVCTVLGIVNGRDAVSRLDGDEVGTTDVIDSMGRPQRASVVNEAGLYGLIFVSRKPEAQAFKRWIKHDVLPALRRTGRYEVAPALPRSYADALRELAAQVEETERVRAELEEAAPKASAWQVLASADGDYSVREAAYILNRDPAISTGAQRLFRLLRDWKIVGPGDIPYAAHETHVRLRPRSYAHPKTGEEIPTKAQVRITAAGLAYLHRRMGGTSPLDTTAIERST